MNIKEKKILAPDEVDLVRVFVLTINFFVKNRFIFIFSTVLGLAAGSAYFKLKSNVYESKLIAECQSIPDSRVVDLLLDLDKIRKYEDWKQLASKLEMTESEVKLIKMIEPLPNITIEKEAKGIDDYLLPTTETSYKFGVIVKVKNNNILPKIQAGIVSYLTKNPYSNLRVNRFLENRKSLLNYITLQMKSLDSLNMVFASKVNTSSASMSTLTSPGDFKSILISLKEKSEAIEDEIRFTMPVRIIQPFTAFNKPIEPVFIEVIAIALLLFNVLGVIFMILRNLVLLYNKNKNSITQE